jgi:putative ABC transport system permease protein
MVLADGVVLGTVGAIAGIAAGVGAGVLARPYIEEYFAHSRAGGYRFFPLALAVIAVLAIVTGLLAALVPAFITARQDVVASLAGRRGVTRSRKRWILLGAAMVVAGTAVVVYGTQRIESTFMLVGLVLGELGLVLCTPALVGLIARIGRLLPLAPRIALRDAARNRASAAPAISAVMAAVAGSVAIGLYIDSSHAQQREHQQLSMVPGSVYVYTQTSTFIKAGPGVASPTVDPAALAADAAAQKANAAKAEAAARATLPVSAVRPISTAGCAPAAAAAQHYCDLFADLNPAAVCPWLEKLRTLGRELTATEARQANADPRCDNASFSGFGSSFGGMTIEDGSGLKALTGASDADIAAATAVLAAGGVVVTDARYLTDGTVTLGMMDLDPNGEVKQDPHDTAPRRTFPGYAMTTSTVDSTAFISPGALAQTSFVARPAGILVTNSRMPTTPESDRFSAQMNTLGLGFNLQSDQELETDPRLWIIMAAAGLITLAAAAIGTGLAAADSRGDLSTLASVGASPRMRRGLSLSQSGVIAGLGSLLGAVAGLGAAIAVLYALNQRYVEIWPGPDPLPIAVPWLSLATALLVVPAIAVLGAGLLTRSRLPIERRT